MTRVLHLTTYGGGGAGVAAARTVCALRQAGVEAELRTGDMMGRGRNGWSKWVARLDSLPHRLFPRRQLFTAWSNAWRSGRIVDEINAASPDAVHLHWIGHGFMSPSELARIKAPLVWSMHDLWALTGGCHYPADCERYKSGCGACPQLGTPAPFDLSGRNHRRKKAVLDRVRRWVAPSEWIGGMARRSGLIDSARVRVIPNTLDVDVFTASRREAARRGLGFSPSELLIAVGSLELDEIRKGNGLLPGILAAWRGADPDSSACLLVFGAKTIPEIDVRGLRVVPVGLLGTPGKVADVLAAADVFILPSLQDNLPNVAIEAQACGCPVAGFDSGGLREIIEPGVTGWLAVEKTAASLGGVLGEYTRRKLAGRDELAARCRGRALSLYGGRTHAEALMRLYEELSG